MEVEEGVKRSRREVEGSETGRGRGGREGNGEWERWRRVKREGEWVGETQGEG